MLTTRLDNALTNVLTGVGTRNRDASLYNSLPLYSYIPNWDEQGEWRRKSWACRKIIDIPPRYMCREWGEYAIADDDPKLADAMNVLLKQMRIRVKFQEAQTIANLRGNAGILLIVDDGENDYSKPIQWNRVKTPPKLSKVYSCRYLRPDTQALWEDLGEDNKPAAFHLFSPSQSGLVGSDGKPIQGASDRVHGDRVLWFRGSELDEDTRRRNHLVSGCDDSVLVNFVDVWMRYAGGMEALASAMNKSNILMHGIQGLFEKLTNGGAEAEGAIARRLQNNLLSMSAYRGVAYDKDAENIAFMSATMGGYAESVDRLKEEMIAASNLAPSIFFLTFASGIDAAGKIHSEQQAINAELKSLQESKFQDNIDHLLKIIHAAKTSPTKGKEPDAWEWKWRDLYAPTASDRADLQTKYSQLDAAYAGLAAAAGLSPGWEKTVLKSRFGKPEFNPNLTVDFDELEKEAEEAQAAMEQAPPEEGLPPEEAPVEETPPDEGMPVENLDSADSLTDKEWSELATVNPDDVLAIMEDILDA